MRSRRRAERALSARASASISSSLVRSVVYAGVPGCCRHESARTPASSASNPVCSTSLIPIARCAASSAATGSANRPGVPGALHDLRMNSTRCCSRLSLSDDGSDVVSTDSLLRRFRSPRSHHPDAGSSSTCRRLLRPSAPRKRTEPPRYRRERHRDNHDVCVDDRLGLSHGLSTGGERGLTDGLGRPRVCNRNDVTRFAETAREHASTCPAPMIPIFMIHPPARRSRRLVEAREG